MPKLRCMYVYLTDGCNLRCAHCWQAAPLLGEGRASFLRFADCVEFLDAAVGQGLMNVTLSGGEPLLNDDFPQFAEYMSRHSLNCALETNGVLLTGRRLKAVVENGIYCAISLDGASSAVHSKTRGAPGCFEQTCRGIRRLEEANRRYQILMAVSHLNLGDVEPLADLIAAEWRCCDLLKINFVWPEGRGADLDTEGALLQPGEILDFVAKAGEMVQKYRFRIGLHVPPAFFTPSQRKLRYGCGGSCGYHQALSLLADGSVSICSLGKYHADLVLGHVTSIDLAKAWNEDSMMRSIHESTHTRLRGVCALCVFRRECLGGCRAAALHAYDNFFAPYPPCQKLFESGRFPERWLDPVRGGREALAPAACGVEAGRV